MEARMPNNDRPQPRPLPDIVKVEGEEPLFGTGVEVRVLTRTPIGHFRVPNYVRGKRGRIEAVVRPPGVNNEDEGFGRNAGEKRHYYRIAIPMTELWSNYRGSPIDGLRIEVFETWLERA
jgi:nitrile hydratase